MFNSPRKRPALVMRVPNILGMQYAPGPQVNSPGNSVLPYGGFPASFFHAIPWPDAVPTLGLLSNFAGEARDRPVGIVNNAVASLPMRNMYIGGFAGKSKG